MASMKPSRSARRKLEPADDSVIPAILASQRRLTIICAVLRGLTQGERICISELCGDLNKSEIQT
jgi:hypothetical protein